MLDLIVKNGLCYIDGKLQKQDIGIINNKIFEIGALNSENSKDVIQVKQLVNEVIKKWGYGEWQDVCTLNDEAKHEAKLLMLDSLQNFPLDLLESNPI